MDIEKIAGLLDMLDEVVLTAQRRKDKDIEFRSKPDNKTKLREDRKKPKGLPKSDPDAKDVKKDPDLKKGGLRSERMLVAKKLVRMAKLMIAAEMNFKKTYSVKDGTLTVFLSWKDSENDFDFDDLMLGGSEEMSDIDDELRKIGVKRKPDNLQEKSWEPTEHDMTLRYYVPEDKHYETVLHSAGFKKD